MPLWDPSALPPEFIPVSFIKPPNRGTFPSSNHFLEGTWKTLAVFHSHGDCSHSLTVRTLESRILILADSFTSSYRIHSPIVNYLFQWDTLKNTILQPGWLVWFYATVLISVGGIGANHLPGQAQEASGGVLWYFSLNIFKPRNRPSFRPQFPQSTSLFKSFWSEKVKFSFPCSNDLSGLQAKMELN